MAGHEELDELLDQASSGELRKLIADLQVAAGAVPAACLVGYVVTDAVDGAEDVWSSVASVLPAGMLPNGIRRVPELPRSRSGKVDEPALRALGERAASLLDVSPPGPGDPVLSERILPVWRAVLRRPCDESTDFFRHGGSSVLAMRMTARLSASLGVQIPLTEVFRHPRISAYAGRVAELLDAQGRVTA